MVSVLARRVEIDAAVGGAAVVLHLEGEAGVGRAVGVGGRGEHQVAGGDVGRADELARPCTGDAVDEVSAAGGRQRGDPHRGEARSAGESFGSVKPKSAAANV